MNAFPSLPGPFGQKRPRFYVCTCASCGFEQKYMLGDFSVISAEDSNEQDEPIQVAKIPKLCPKCGGKFNKKQIPDFLRY